MGQTQQPDPNGDLLPQTSASPHQREDGDGSIEHPWHRLDDVARRLLDLFVSSLLLLLFFPVLLSIAAAILLDSPGPVLFIQKRVGKGGREFSFYKFRSMVAQAEQVRSALADKNERDGPVFKMRQDPRVTKTGFFLRRYSLDELPQLLNVLRGDMSLVGPRPALPKEVARYTSRDCGRLAVRPGLTGLWQVSGRADLSFEQSIHYDLTYIARRSVWFDLIILLRTVPAVLSTRGAY